MIVGGMKRPWRHLPAPAACANPEDRTPPHLCEAGGQGHLGPQPVPEVCEPGGQRGLVTARGAVVPKARRSQHERPQALQPAVQFFGHHVVMRVPAVTQPKHGGGLPGQQVGGKGAAEQGPPQRAQRGRGLTLAGGGGHPHDSAPGGEGVQGPEEGVRRHDGGGVVAAQGLPGDTLGDILE